MTKKWKALKQDDGVVPKKDDGFAILPGATVLGFEGDDGFAPPRNVWKDDGFDETITLWVHFFLFQPAASPKI